MIDNQKLIFLLKKWFDAHKRPFPWREKKTPYRVFVSETMLQQTRAHVVVPYFEKWMEKFPDFASLSNAQEKEVLKAEKMYMDGAITNGERKNKIISIVCAINFNNTCTTDCILICWIKFFLGGFSLRPS